MARSRTSFLALVRRNQMYYFRIRVPSDLSSFFPTPEIKKSLKTKDFSTAKVLASSFGKRVQTVFALLRTHSLPADEIPRVVTSIFPVKSSLKVKFISDEIIVSALSISQIFSLYVEDRSPRWSRKTRMEFECQFNVIKSILGEKSIDAYTREDCVSFRTILQKLPTNFTKRKECKGKSVKSALLLNLKPTLHPKTINKYLVLLSTLFKWSVSQGYVSRNPAEGLLLPLNERPENERKAYDSSNIKQIYNSLPRKVEEPEKTWIPLIAIHTGMRLDEICQLNVKDVKKVEDIYCIDVNDDGDKSLKTISSKRILPIHSKLITLGFLDYVETIRKGNERLWPNLKSDKYGKYGKFFGKWYSGFNRKNITTDPKKCFHSFRHSFADSLKQAGIQERIISELLGHRNDNISTGRYGKGYGVKVLYKSIEQVSFIE